MCMFLLLTLVRAEIFSSICSDDNADPSDVLSLSTSILDAAVSSIHYVEQSRIFIVTQNRSLYLSVDDGINWKLINVRKDVVDRTMPSMDVEYCAVSPANSSVLFVFAHSDNRLYWRSLDGGVSFVLIENRQQAIYEQFHPRFEHVLFATQWVDRCFASCRNETVDWHPNVLLSFDYGSTWVLVAEYATPSSFSTGEDGANSLLFLEDPSKERGWSGCERGCLLMRVDFDAREVLFLTVTSLISDVLAAASVSWSGSMWLGAADNVPVLFVARRDFARNNSLLSVSTDGGVLFSDCVFTGLGAAAPRDVWYDYAPLVADDTALVVAVHDANAGSKSGATIFVADIARPTAFVARLRNVRQNVYGVLSAATDFEQLQGIDGVFVANRLLNNTCAQTVMSIDMGATWKFIDAGALCNDTTHDCSLHFFGLTSQFGAIYSAAPAVGVWFAQGNVGACLESVPRPSTLTTYVSSDGGLHWQALASGAVTYELGGAGGFLSAAQQQQQQQNVSTALLSIDFGVHWRECAIPLPSMTSLVVQNILARSAVAQSFLLYGYMAATTASPALSGVVTRMAFAQPLLDCGRPLAADGVTPTDNYELFRVANECVAGHDLVYVRRRASARCASEADVEDARIERVCDGMSLRTRPSHIGGSVPTTVPVFDSLASSVVAATATRNEALLILGLVLLSLIIVTVIVIVVIRLQRRRRLARYDESALLGEET